MADNPLKRHFRTSSLFIKLPSNGRWYTEDEVCLTSDKELPIYPMTSLDDILLNTPDAMLNGQALEKVIQNCAPDVKNVKRLLLPDLDAIFVGIKSATNVGKVEYDRKCPKCEAENTFELDCHQLLFNMMTFIDEDDLTIRFDDELIIHIKPYDFEMRQIFIKKEFEEEKVIQSLKLDPNKMDELVQAAIFGESVDRLSKITFTLASRSIEKIVMLKEKDHQKSTVVDQQYISEWLMNISKNQADIIIKAIDKLNNTGIVRILPVMCAACSHQWEDEITFDPSSFFAKRS